MASSMTPDRCVSSSALRRFVRDFSRTERCGWPALARVNGALCRARPQSGSGAVARANLAVSTTGERKSAGFARRSLQGELEIPLSCATRDNAPCSPLQRKKHGVLNFYISILKFKTAYRFWRWLSGWCGLSTARQKAVGKRRSLPFKRGEGA
jgi:hypothetical protein